jgi:hypothetical protein
MLVRTPAKPKKRIPTNFTGLRDSSSVRTALIETEAANLDHPEISSPDAMGEHM